MNYHPLLRLLNLRPSERRPVAMLWAHSFFLGLGVAYVISSALPIFLVASAIDQLPLAFILAATAELLIGAIVHKIEPRVRASRLLVCMPLALAIATLAFRLLIGSNAIATVSIAFGLVVWARCTEFVAQSEFWALASLLFDVRQGKRLFSLIDSGSFLAKIIGYLSVPLLLRSIAVPDLLILSAAGSMGAFLILQQIVRRYRVALDHIGTRSHPLQRTQHTHLFEERAALRLQPAKSEHHPSPLRLLARHRYLATVASVSFFAVFALTCIDYGFLRGVDQRYQNVTQIATFIGLVLGIAKAASLLMKAGFVSRLFDRFGLARTSVLLPLSLTLITIGGLASSFDSSSTNIIWFFTASMFLVEMWSESVSWPAQVVALQPLHHSERQEGQHAIDNIIEPLGLFASGLLLYGLSTFVGFSLREISWVMIVVFGAWAAALLVFDREYRSMLVRALRHRRLESNEIAWNDDVRKVVQQKLESAHAGEKEYSLRLIPKSDPDFFIAQLRHLIAQSDETLMIAIGRITEFQFDEPQREELASILQSLLQTSSSPSLIGVVLEAYISLHLYFAESDLQYWLNDNRSEIQQGLLAAIIRNHGIDGVPPVGKRTRSLLHSDSATDRILCANIVGRTGDPRFYDLLLVLLKDSNSDVQLAAVEAAAKVNSPELIEPVLDLYLESSVGYAMLGAIERTLRSFGRNVLPHLAKHIESGLFDSSRLQRIMRLLGQWGSERAERMLTDFINWPVKHNRVLSTLRHAALRAIVQSEIVSSDSQPFEAVLHEELERAKTLLELAMGLEHAHGYHPDSGYTPTATILLHSAIAFELQETASRVLLLLAVLYDRKTILRVRDSIYAGSDLHRGNALEMLAAMLPQSYVKDVIALFEASIIVGGRGAQAVTLRDIANFDVREDHISIHALLAPIILDENRFYDPWTVSVAVYYAGLLLWEAFGHEIHQAANRQDIAGTIAQVILQYHAPLIQLSEGVEKANIATPILSTSHIKGNPMLILFERVILLKSVDLFHETPDPVLAHIAQAMEEIHAPRGTTIIEKGELGTCLYIIVEGKVKVHDGDHELATLGSRQVVGELALLDPEPRSAFVTTLEETSLLKLDWEVFYDLMVDNIEIARGALATLSRRIRKQNAVIAELQTAREAEVA